MPVKTPRDAQYTSVAATALPLELELELDQTAKHQTLGCEEWPAHCRCLIKSTPKGALRIHERLNAAGYENNGDDREPHILGRHGKVELGRLSGDKVGLDKIGEQGQE